jgi:hypothetical protein
MLFARMRVGAVRALVIFRNRLMHTTRTPASVVISIYAGSEGLPLMGGSVDGHLDTGLHPTKSSQVSRTNIS